MGGENEFPEHMIRKRSVRNQYDDRLANLRTGKEIPVRIVEFLYHSICAEYYQKQIMKAVQFHIELQQRNGIKCL